MAENGSDPGRATPADPQSGVLGNLPRSRPAVRSPRRRDATPETGADVRSTSGPSTAGRPEGAEGRDSSPADLEALARGGIAIAGGAASLGLRIAGRAAAAVRGAVERR